jgi:hypothetical protein
MDPKSVMIIATQSMVGGHVGHQHALALEQAHAHVERVHQRGVIVHLRERR